MTITLRDDHDAASLRALARQTTPVEVRQRMLGIAAIYEGASRSAAADIAGIGRQVLRDWVIRFNAEGPSGLYDGDRKGGGGETLSPEHRAVLGEILDRGLRTAGGARKASLEEMLAELKTKTGRTLSVRCLSQHIARTQGEARGPVGAGTPKCRYIFKELLPTSSNERMDLDP